MSRTHVIFAVFRRNVLSYFSGVLGYLFIIVFVVAGSLLAFRPEFFTNNLANLDQLSEYFPMLLLFIVPAITMSAWADEKKLGTDELLFTLPASDLEILLGKYLAVLAVYTITLAFSVTHVIMLAWIGDPDWGMLASTYLGYWLAGAALLSGGMVGSVLTSSTTVAFVLGVAVCAVPVFIGQIAPNSDFFAGLSVGEQLRDFTLGVVPAGGVLYFVSLTVFMLYINLIFISKRHWSSGQQANMGSHYLARAVMLAVTLIAWNYTAGHAALRGDLTAENLYSLSPTTRTLIDKVSSERPVMINAYISPEVPREYVPVRKRLIGLLRQYDQLGGTRIDVRIVDVEPYSEQADEAQHFGIEAVRVRSERDGRRLEEEIYMGAVISSSYDEVVVPFFGAAMPLEYELTRSVHTVSNEERLTVGVLSTDAQIIGPSAEWQIVTELKKQYTVEEVSPDSPITEGRYDVLLAVLPSSLTQPQMDNFVDYVKQGHATLIFDDPFPWVFNSGFGVTNAPRQPKPSPGGGMGGMFGNRQQAPPKADNGQATSLLRVLEIAWDNGEVVWDQFNPHPEFFNVVPAEFLFISPQSGTRTAFSLDSEITNGLQEMLAAFSGTIRPRADSKLRFEPLLRTGPNSGLLGWDDFTTPGFDFMRMQPTAQLKPQRTYYMDNDAHVVAAHMTSSGPDGVNVVYVADLDLISDWFFMERSQGESNLKLDNVAFVLNAVDVLAGETAYVELRKRRSEHRTLELVEARTAEFVKERNLKQQKADEKAQAALEAARNRFDKQREAIENDTSLDPRQKEMMLANLEKAEQRRLDVTESNIEREKQKEIDEIRALTTRQIRAAESQIMATAVIWPPVPALLMGIVFFIRRVNAERRTITPDRRVTP